MTRQEAKKIMENEVRCVRNPNCERLECRNCYLVMPEHTVLKAYDVAIKALEQEPCEDAISRDAVWEVMQELWGTSGELMDRLMALPSVKPQEPKTGHWIEYTRVLIPEPINKWEQAWYCSECGYGNQECEDGSAWLEWKYCPNCGCRMVEPQESEGAE